MERGEMTLRGRLKAIFAWGGVQRRGGSGVGGAVLCNHLETIGRGTERWEFPSFPAVFIHHFADDQLFSFAIQIFKELDHRFKFWALPWQTKAIIL